MPRTLQTPLFGMATILLWNGKEMAAIEQGEGSWYRSDETAQEQWTQDQEIAVRCKGP